MWLDGFQSSRAVAASQLNVDRFRFPIRQQMGHPEAGGVDNAAFQADDKGAASSDSSPATHQQVDGRGTRPVSSMSAQEIRTEKLRIWKNIIVICLSFMCLFTAYNSMANLQSSINSREGLGTASLSTVYASIVISCMFVPTWLIKTIKCKWTLFCCQLCYCAYIGAQFYPEFYTLIPGAIILGLGAAPMWSAKCTYLTQVGNRYAELAGEKVAEPTITRFFGVFFMIFQTSQIWGNLITSLVLSSGENTTDVDYDLVQGMCGANFCNESVLSGGDSSTSSEPSKEKLYTMAGILLAFAILAAVVIAVLVDPLTRYGEDERQGSNAGRSGWQLLMATFRHMRHPYQMLIAPLTVWSGFEQAFLQADFTAAFISCSWGVHHVGFVLICYGAADAIGSLVCGNVVKKVGRVPIFCFGAAINVALIVTLLTWEPDPSQPAIFFVLAALWGLADAVWQTQINAFYGVIFPAEEEAAFSNYRLWESIGFIIAYAYSTFICVNAKLYVLIGVLAAGMAGYLAIEVKERRNSKNGFNLDASKFE